MKKKIHTIQEEWQAAQIHMLPAFIKDYEKDERKGVQLLVEKAKGKLSQIEKEKKRLWEMERYERQYKDRLHICGVDEVGRGPLAGPVAAGAVILPKNCEILYINDSKKLSEKKREELYKEIMEKAIAVGIGWVEPERIDEINILQATYEAMAIAIQNLAVTPDILLNDGVIIPKVSIEQVNIIKGDEKSVSIGAASIVAKVERDKKMEEYDRKYPEYRFCTNKGYGTKEHMEALKKYGPTPIHRRSFIGNII